MAVHFAFAGCAVAMMTAVAAADTWFVDASAAPGGSGTSPATAFTEIQPAIDAAADGDVITVIAGDYDGPIDLLGKAITLVAPAGRDATSIIGGSPVVQCVNGETAETVIMGFTIRGGSGVAIAGSGIRILGASPTIIDCRVRDNTGNSTAAVSAYYGAPEFRGCEIVDNVGEAATTVRVGDGSVRLVDCVIARNRSITGIAVFGTAVVELIGCEIVDHDSMELGTCMLVDGHATLIGCVVARNTASFIGGAMVVTGTAILQNCAISRNTAQIEAGGAFVAPMASLSVDSCSLSGNTPAGINVQSSNDRACTLRNTIVRGGADAPAIIGLFTAAHCNIEGGAPGSGNIDVDPLFVQPGADDLRLGTGSPCLEAGDRWVLPLDPFDIDGDGDVYERLPLDLAGAPRVQNDQVDIGAYEGAAEPLPPAWSVADIDPGDTVIIVPGGGSFSPLTEGAVLLSNTSGPPDGTATATALSMSAAWRGPYAPIGGAMRLETTLPDGSYFSATFLPLSPGMLGGISPFAIEPVRIDPDTGVTEHAALAATTGPGRRIHTVAPAPPGLTQVPGDFGVYWDPQAQAGYAWVNSDVPGDIAPGVAACPADCAPLGGDGLIDIGDLVRLVLAWGQGTASGCDLDFDGTVTEFDLLALLDAWGVCAP